MQAVFVFLSIFLILVSSKTTKPEEPSHLHRIAGNFRILARVTNAIHIQSTIIKKSIKIRELLSEFSHIPSNRLNVLLDMDIPTASLELNRIYKTQKETRDKLAEFTAKQEFSVYEFAQNLLELLPHNIMKLKKSLNISSDALFKEVQSVGTFKMLNSPCAVVHHENIRAFLDMFTKDGEHGILPKDEEIIEILNGFVNQKGKILSCLETFKTANYSESEKVSQLYDDYAVVENSVKYALDFASHLKPLVNLSDYVKFVHEQLDRTTQIWKREKKSPAVAKAMEQLTNAAVFYKDYKEKIGYIVPDNQNLTGFIEPKDMLEVSEDLKKQWFKKRVAMNQNTKELEEALQPFHKVSMKIVNLTSTWLIMKEAMNGAFYTLNMLNVVGRMENITKFSENSTYFLNLLENSGQSLGKCIKNVKPAFKEFEKFRMDMQSITNIVIPLETLVTDLKKFGHHLSHPLDKNRNRSLLYGRILNFTEDIITFDRKNDFNVLRTLKKVETYINNEVGQIQEETGDDSFDFLDSLKHIRRIAKDMKYLKENKLKLRNADVKQLLSHVNLIEIHNCLKQANFDASTMNFVISVMNSMMTDPNHENIVLINQYLNHLGKVQKEYAAVEKVLKDVMSKPLSSNHSNLILSMKESQMLSEHIGANTRFLENLELNRRFRGALLNVTEFPEDIQNFIKERKFNDWANPLIHMKSMLNGADRVNEVAGNVKGQDLMKMADVFVEAAYVPGLAGTPKNLKKMIKRLAKSGIDGREKAEKYLKEVTTNFDLDFASHRARLQNSRVVVLSLKKYFDDVFSKPKTEKQSDTYVTGHSWLTILSFCIGTIILLLTGAFLLYGWTENGRTKYINIWLYYFGKQDQFEKRWRYSLFLDYTFGRNQMHEAVREVNKINLKKVLKNGAYINAYNRFGNTALHVATKLAQPELVELLIKHGADRTLLNVQNQTPYQMIPLKFRDTDKAEDFEKVQLIYRQYKNKNFRLSVPQVFPESSFHVWVEDNVSDETTTSTHCAVKTDENGVLHVEKIDHLSWIFNGTIIVKEQWLIDCLEDETLIMQDSKYLVEKVEYKGVIYDTVLKWSEAMAKGTMPFLQGVFVAIVMEKYDKLKEFSILVDYQGGMVMEQFPLRKYFNKGSHPYLHAHLPPLFLIHDGSIDLTRFKNDPDKMYTLFTEEEFLVFMLKREINRDVRERPIPVLKEREH